MTRKYNQLLIQQQRGSAATTSANNNKSLTDIFISSGSDKYHRHHYETYYTRWLHPYRSISNLKLLEIGAKDGNSLVIWYQYFISPVLILGLSYGKHTNFIEQNIKNYQHSGILPSNNNIVQIIIGDQSKVETMEILRKSGPYHIIIDDGSHVPDHMIFSLFSLWKSILPGGIYVIEDLECNYWTDGSNIYGYILNGTGIGVSPKYNAVEKIKQFIDILIQRQIGIQQPQDISIMPDDHLICSIDFGKNLVAIHKCNDYETINVPILQNITYNIHQMKDWVIRSRSTNPKGFQ